MNSADRHNARVSTGTAGSVDALGDPDDREYVSSLDEPELRETVISSLLRHRQPDRLRPGDHLPALDLLDPDDRRPVPLETLLDGRPLVLVFGSHT